MLRSERTLVRLELNHWSRPRRQASAFRWLSHPWPSECIIAREFSDEVEFAWLEEQEIDPEKQSTILRGYAEDGIMSINETRENLGLAPSDDPAASRLQVKTQTGYVPIGEVSEGGASASGPATTAPVVMQPPPAKKRLRSFKLASGVEYFPDDRGAVHVDLEKDARELEREGWSRTPLQKTRSH